MIVETVYRVGERIFETEEEATRYVVETQALEYKNTLAVFDREQQPMSLIDALSSFDKIGDVFYVKAETFEASSFFYEMYTSYYGYCEEGLFRYCKKLQWYNIDNDAWEVIEGQ